MPVKMRKKSLIYSWFELYLDHGGTPEWRSNWHLVRKLLVDTVVLCWFSPVFRGKFVIPHAFYVLFGFILGMFWF